MEDRVVIFSSIQAIDVHLVRSTLTREGIVSFIQSQHLSPLAGEVPFDDARVELYVHPDDEARALEIIQDAKSAEGPERSCPSCGEANPHSFEVCWQCGEELE